jgi:hypothetical protein
MDLGVAIKEARETFSLLSNSIEKCDDERVDSMMSGYDTAIRAILTYSPQSVSEFKLKADFILSDLIDEFEDPHQIAQYCEILKSEIAALKG